MAVEYPYPNPFEILRVVLRALDLKHSNKRLDELATQRAYDPRLLLDFIDKDFSQVVDRYLGKNVSELFVAMTKSFIDEYLYLVGSVDASGITRKEMISILVNSHLNNHVVSLAAEIYKTIGGPHPSSWFSTQQGTVKISLSWLNENKSGWSAFLSTLNKEQRDRVSAWEKGDNLPSSQHISLLDQYGDTEKVPDREWENIKILLFVARAFDWVGSLSFGLELCEQARLALWGANDQCNIPNEVHNIQKLIQGQYGDILPSISRLQNELSRTSEKIGADEYWKLLEVVRGSANRSDRLKEILYWVSWHEARWHVFYGNLEEANKLYKSAYEDSLFRAGENQKLIIDEAMVVAASLTNPDKVFLKKLKWSLINFNYDIPSVSSDEPSTKHSDTIEEWEISLWRGSFNTIFPKEGLFPGVVYDSTPEFGPLVLSDKSRIKPDYRYPNRKIKVGETWQRTMPQLVWFSMIENYDVCGKLLEKGADVNCSSEVGDTPILMALETMNVRGVPYRTLDDRLFWLISEKPHSKEIINTRTQKKRLLPIVSAVESGRLDVVRKVLDMGANPNGRGQTDEQTALNVCLKIIGILKEPKLAEYQQRTMPITPEALDSIRRGSHAMSGFTLEQQEQYLRHIMLSELFEPVFDIVIEGISKRIQRHTNIETMRDIAKLLIESGADVNAEHASPVKGYTPLMLAAELDERELFDAMLVKGGNIQKKYKDPRSGKDVSLIDIARGFRANNVQQTLKEISSHTTIH